MDVRFEDKALNALLRAELTAGNVVAEVTSWPPKCERLIILTYRFLECPVGNDLLYREINDPHYWLAEFEAENGREVLACRFETRPDGRSA